MALPILTGARLRHLVEYDSQTGKFVRRMHGRRTAGTVRPLGTLGNGYLRASVGGERHLLHRLAWLYVFDVWPIGWLDHINGNGLDNRIANLREATPEVNSQNQRTPHANNRTGYLGVFSPRPGKWTAALRLDGRIQHLGTFDAPEVAHQAYLKAKRRLHTGCTI